MRGPRPTSRAAMLVVATTALFIAGSIFVSAPALAVVPQVPLTKAPTAITATTATVDGELNPTGPGEPGEYEFLYSQSATECTGGRSVPEPPGTALGTEKEVVAPAELTGLEPSKEYTFCLLARNAGESSTSAPRTFETLPLPPSIDSEIAIPDTSHEETFEAKINPNNQETTYRFEYAPNPELKDPITVPVTAPPPLPAVDEELFAVVATGATLMPNTTYYYRAVAENARKEVTYDTVEHFTTLDTPAVTTSAAQSIGRTVATLSGIVNPDGAATTYHFAYIDQSDYEAAVAENAQNPYASGLTTPELSVPLSETSQAVGPIRIEELQPGETYDYAVVATNSVGTTIGPNVVFTTATPTPPLVSTGPAGGITQLSASIAGTIDTQDLPTIAEFEFGSSPYSGSFLPAVVEPGVGSALQISASLGGDLQPGTTYYYRAIASNTDGVSYGSEQSFTTSLFSAPFTVPQMARVIPYASIAELDSREKQEDKTLTTTLHLTRAQELSRALKACTREPKRTRAQCREHAKRKYASSKKKTS